jgi:hypothetical protein
MFRIYRESNGKWFDVSGVKHSFRSTTIRIPDLV